MSEYRERAVQLRATIEPHYNCCVSVVIPFAVKAEIPEETLMRITANFRRGMRNGGRCGAVCGGIMVLGMFGIDDPAIIGQYYQRLRDSHEGLLDCADLLRRNKELGGEKKPHCDAMVYECVQLTEEILREQGKL